LFERPLDFRKMDVSLGDAFTIHGASFVRPPIQAIPLDRAFATNDTFLWRGHEFACIDTRGTSPGGMTYLLRANGAVFAFSGDVMLDGATMHTWFDTEWDYGFAAGIRVSTAKLMGAKSPSPATIFLATQMIRLRPAMRRWSHTTVPSWKRATSTAPNS